MAAPTPPASAGPPPARAEAPDGVAPAAAESRRGGAVARAIRGTGGGAGAAGSGAGGDTGGTGGGARRGGRSRWRDRLARREQPAREERQAEQAAPARRAAEAGAADPEPAAGRARPGTEAAAVGLGPAVGRARPGTEAAVAGRGAVAGRAPSGNGGRGGGAGTGGGSGATGGGAGASGSGGSGGAGGQLAGPCSQTVVDLPGAAFAPPTLVPTNAGLAVVWMNASDDHFLQGGRDRGRRVHRWLDLDVRGHQLDDPRDMERHRSGADVRHEGRQPRRQLADRPLRTARISSGPFPLPATYGLADRPRVERQRIRDGVVGISRPSCSSASGPTAALRASQVLDGFRSPPTVKWDGDAWLTISSAMVWTLNEPARLDVTRIAASSASLGKQKRLHHGGGAHRPGHGDRELESSRPSATRSGVRFARFDRALTSPPFATPMPAPGQVGAIVNRGAGRDARYRDDHIPGRHRAGHAFPRGRSDGSALADDADPGLEHHRRPGRAIRLHRRDLQRLGDRLVRLQLSTSTGASACSTASSR